MAQLTVHVPAGVAHELQDLEQRCASILRVDPSGVGAWCIAAGIVEATASALRRHATVLHPTAFGAGRTQRVQDEPSEPPPTGFVPLAIETDEDLAVSIGSLMDLHDDIAGRFNDVPSQELVLRGVLFRGIEQMHSRLARYAARAESAPRAPLVFA